MSIRTIQQDIYPIIMLDQHYHEAANYLASRLPKDIKTAIILGSGLGKLGDMLQNPTIIPYTQIPHFPHSTAIGHKGNLIAGTLSGILCSACRDASTTTRVTLWSKSPSPSV